MKNEKQKKLIKISLGFVVAAFFFATVLVNTANAFTTELQVENPSTTYKGPLCSDQSGTTYCCQDTEGSCSAGAACPSCQ